MATARAAIPAFFGLAAILVACADFGGYHLDANGGAGASDGGDPGDILPGPDGSCPADRTKCGGVCIDVTRDLRHCSACDKPCNSPAGTRPVCQGSVCGNEPLPGPDGGPGEVLCYPDADGDGVPKSTAPTKFPGACPAGWIAVGGAKFDCDDANPVIKPGQTQYFTVPASTDFWDYDCDGELLGDRNYVIRCGDLDATECPLGLRVYTLGGISVTLDEQLYCGGSGAMRVCRVSNGNCVEDTTQPTVTRTIACH